MTDIEKIRDKLQLMSATKVAKKAGLSFDTVKKIMDGNEDITLGTLRKLIDALDLRTD